MVHLVRLLGVSLFFLSFGAQAAPLSCWENPALKPAQVNGANNAPFIREVTSPGVDTISACVKIPEMEQLKKYRSRLPDTRNPDIYLGFNFKSGENAEIGLMLQGADGQNESEKIGFTFYIRLPDLKLRRGRRAARFYNYERHWEPMMRWQPGDTACWSAKFDRIQKTITLTPDESLTQFKDESRRPSVFNSWESKLEGFGTQSPSYKHPLKVKFSPKLSTGVRARRVMDIAFFGFKGVAALTDTAISAEWSHSRVSGTLAPTGMSFADAVDRSPSAPNRCDRTVTWPYVVYPSGLSSIVTRTCGEVEVRQILGPQAQLLQLPSECE